MARNIVFVASSLDGYIARKDGSVDWLIEDPTYEYYSTFIERVGVILMGADSYRFILSCGIDWPYPDHVSYVFTHSKEYEDTENIRFVDEDVASLMQRVRVEEGKDVWLMGGSDLIRQFMEKRLVDEVIVGIMPIILGEGIPLFSGGIEERLKLKNTNSYEKGMVQIEYEVVK